MLVGHERSIAHAVYAREVGLALEPISLARVSLAMEMDEAFNPIEVSLLGAEGILLDPNSVADAVEQTRSGRSIHCCRFRFHYWPLAR